MTLSTHLSPCLSKKCQVQIYQVQEVFLLSSILNYRHLLHSRGDSELQLAILYTIQLLLLEFKFATQAMCTFFAKISGV